MAKYIEKGALLDDLILLAKYQTGDKQRGILGCVETIWYRPAADVASVRHGRWVDRIVDENEVIQPWMKRYYCSECLEGGSQSWFKYCPNCGCRMDGDDDE